LRATFTCQDLHRTARVAQSFHEFAIRKTKIIPIIRRSQTLCQKAFRNAAVN